MTQTALLMYGAGALGFALGYLTGTLLHRPPEVNRRAYRAWQRVQDQLIRDDAKRRARGGIALLVVALALTPGPALAWPPIVYETRTPTLTTLGVLDYAWVLAQPIGSCAAAWQPLYLVTGPLLVGDVVTAHATLMLSARESAAQAAVGWVIHVEPWTGTLPLNVEMPCMTEPWVGEDISAAYRPYLATSAHRVIVVDRDLPAGMLVLYRVYAQSATPGGPLVIAPTSPDLVVTVQRLRSGK